MSIDVAVPAERAWEALSDWESQSTWMLATRVSGTASAAGEELAARTALGPFGFVDTMTVTEWDPPHRCVVLHTGSVVRGTGGFEVAPNGQHRCRVVWWERVDLPFGVLGRAGWTVAAPLTRLFFASSLRRFKRLLENGWPSK